MRAVLAARDGGHSGMGTTLAANPLAIAALDASLRDVITDANYSRMLAVADRLEQSLRSLFVQLRLPWHVARVGARLEFGFGPRAPRNGTESEAAMRPDLEQALHLYWLNRGVLLTPFHNMMLCSPVTPMAAVDRLVATLAEALAELRVAA
jgi:glutamate-1-semialdehyde 2,1-aminomutase